MKDLTVNEAESPSVSSYNEPEVESLKKKLLDAHLANQKLFESQQETPLLRNYVQEVSKFHRETLLPLIEIVKSVIPPNGKGSVFLNEVKARVKHFESQTLVTKARQSAIDEQK